LRQLAELRDEGIISDDDFEAKKKQLLGLWENTSVKRTFGTLGFLLVLALALAACGPAKSDVLTPEGLQNAEYQTEWTETGTVKLENGEYRAPAAPGSASEIVIGLTDQMAFGELDGQPAAAVILFSSGGGSGTFLELHVMVERQGEPYDLAWTYLGDRVQINSLTIKDDQIAVDMVTHGPDDPLCCPTQQVVQTYALQGEELVLTSE